MLITLLIPNRDDPSGAPLISQMWEAQAVPRQGESLEFLGPDGEPISTWRVKWVRHAFQTDNRDALIHAITVRLIEPDHWSLS